MFAPCRRGGMWQVRSNAAFRLSAGLESTRGERGVAERGGGAGVQSITLSMEHPKGVGGAEESVRGEVGLVEGQRLNKGEGQISAVSFNSVSRREERGGAVFRDGGEWGF